MVSWPIALGLTVALLLGCGDDGASSAPSDRRANVMVVDDGFDLSLPVLTRAVMAAFTVSCRDTGDGGAGDTPIATGASEKAALIAQLGVPDDRCELRAGIAPLADPFVDIEAERNDWNAAIRGDRPVDDTPALVATGRALASALETVPFHGTATASLIPYANPDVQLVLVEEPVAGAGSTVAGPCIAQATVDRAVSLLSDRDVRDAYVHRPPATVDEALARVRAERRIGIVNQSFGRPARTAVEQSLRAAGCAPVSLAAYFDVLGQLDRAFEDEHREPGVLFVEAAGNDGAVENSPADGVDCRLDDPFVARVGSDAPDGARSAFSNFGDCVDVYAPGESVAVSLPGDWLFPLDGTSFASPLVVHLLSLTAPVPFDPPSTKRALVRRAGASGDLSAADFPAELLYRPAQMSATSALVSARPPSPVAMHQLFWPLRWLAGGR